MPGAVAAMHPAQDCVRARLQRKMRMASEASRVCDIEQEQLGCPVHWLDGAEAQARERCLFENGSNEIDEALRRLQIASPTSKVDAGEHQLLAATLDEALDRSNAFCK